MPLARRLSSGSTEAFTEFCSKNQPLSRRFSNNGDTDSVSSSSRRNSIARDKGQRILKRRSISACKSHIYAGKKKDISLSSNDISSPEPKKQRTTKNGVNKDKENDGDSNCNGELLLQSPTPYWKVAKDRGDIHSPPETRSTKKNKSRESLLLFSPPNQAANARREKLLMNRKEKERDTRINKKRNSGQLLVYSNNFECLSVLPSGHTKKDEDVNNDDDNDDDRTKHSTKTVKQKSTFKSELTYTSIEAKNNFTDGEGTISSFSIDNDRHVNELEEVSCLTKSTNHNGEDSQEVMTAIKGLDERFGILESHLSELRPPQAKFDDEIPDPDIMRELGEKSSLIKELFKEKLGLEEKNEQLKNEKKIADADLASEQKHFAKIKIELEEYKDKNAALSNEELPKLKKKLQNSLDELKRYYEKAEEYRKNISQFASENDRLSNEIENEKANSRSRFQENDRFYQDQQLDIKKKDQLIGEIKQSLIKTRREFDDALSELEITRQQLKDATSQREKLQHQFLDFKEEIATKNKHNNAAVRIVEGQRDSLKSRLQEFEEQLNKAREEKNNALLRLSTSDQRENDLYSRLHESDRVRKELHSKLMQVIGQIRVFVRVRPALSNEIEALNGREFGKTNGEDELFKFPSGLGEPKSKMNSKYGCDDPTKNILELKEPKLKDRGGLSNRRKIWNFGFDNIFDPSHTQEDLWEASEPLVQCCIDGFNVTLFAYGQTGSGKTFTMLGDDSSIGNEGIISRSIRKLFDAKAQIEENSKGEKQISMTVELLEIYNEKVQDLLATNNVRAGDEKKSLKIAGNKAVGSIHQVIKSKAEVLEILKNAQERRIVKSTLSNATSSRSHLLFTLNFCVSSKDGTKKVGKLRICDLAGSERLSKSGATGSLLQETQHINLSLSNLSNVIEGLQKGEKIVNYRDSSLTNLLKDSLGGNSKTICIVCCNPLQTHFHETLCSLRFAAKINKVALKSVQNFIA